jgi:hypothetical protein
MDYVTLKRTIKTYTENEFPPSFGSENGEELMSDEQLDTFIRQAEQRIYNSAQLLVSRSNRVGQTSAYNPYLTAPTDWLSVYSMAVMDPVSGNYEYLLQKDVNFVREAFPQPNSIGKPSHYALFDENTFLLGPTPDFLYTVELHYFRYPPSIVDNGSSWLGDYFDASLLYGALLEANTLMKGEADVMTMYQKRYDEALAMVKQYAEGKSRQDMYRTEQIRYPVR